MGRGNSDRVCELGTQLVEEIGWMHAIPLESDQATLMYQHYGLERTYDALEDAASAVPEGLARRVREIVKRRIAVAELSASISVLDDVVPRGGILGVWQRLSDAVLLRIWKWRFRKQYLKHVAELTSDVRRRDTERRVNDLRQVAHIRGLEAEELLLDRLARLLECFHEYRSKIGSVSASADRKRAAEQRLEAAYHRALVDLEVG